MSTHTLLERIDLHTHSSYSDGTLTPAALVQLARCRQVQLLALTDHDTLMGCEEAAAACRRHDVQFVTGVELTCQWQGLEVHVVGLGVDPEQRELRRHCEAVGRTRRIRIEALAERLTAQGLPGTALAAAALRAASPTRAHLARALCERGLATSVSAAFDRYLRPLATAAAEHTSPAAGGITWPALCDVVRCIEGAGGLGVLAHPHRYGLSSGRLTDLVGQFKAAGGAGLEVSLPGMSTAHATHIARLARRWDLAGSIGSDFHEPGLPWRPLGRFAKLADAIRPITVGLEGCGALHEVAGRAGR